MSDIRWEGFSHEEIYGRVQQGPGRLASADAEAAWTTVESTIRAVDAQLTRAVKQIGAGWQGRAADAVQGGMTVMSNWALDAAGDATLTRNGITAQAEQAARLRTAMPPPHAAEWNRMVYEEIPAVGLMSATGDLGALEERMANDHAVAVDMMNRYSSQSSDNQRMMNYWTQPPAVVVEAVVPHPSNSTARGALGAAGTPAAVAVRPGAPRPGPPDRAADVDGGTASEAPFPVGTGVPAPGAVATPDKGVTATPTGTAPSAGRRSAPAPGMGRPSSTAEQGRNPATTSAAPGTGRFPATTGPGVVRGPDVVGRAPSAGPPVSSVARRPGAPRAGVLPDRPVGGVRPIVPGPPAQPGAAADRRTGLRPVPVGPPEPVEPPGRVPRAAVPEPAPRPVGMSPEAERVAASRGSAWGGHGVLPMGGVGRAAEQEHRRPAYLVDDTDAFADDRWFPPPVIGGDMRALRA